MRSVILILSGFAFMTSCVQKERELQRFVEAKTTSEASDMDCIWVKAYQENRTYFFGVPVNRRLTGIADQLYWCCVEPGKNVPECNKATWPNLPNFDTATMSPTPQPQNYSAAPKAEPKSEIDTETLPF